MAVDLPGRGDHAQSILFKRKTRVFLEKIHEQNNMEYNSALYKEHLLSSITVKSMFIVIINIIPKCNMHCKLLNSTQ